MSPDSTINTDCLSLDVSVKVPEPVKDKILSMAQDIVYNARHGRVRTPKHVALAIHVHHKTGNMQLV